MTICWHTRVTARPNTFLRTRPGPTRRQPLQGNPKKAAKFCSCSKLKTRPNHGRRKRTRSTERPHPKLVDAGLVQTDWSSANHTRSNWTIRAKTALPVMTASRQPTKLFRRQTAWSGRQNRKTRMSKALQKLKQVFKVKNKVTFERKDSRAGNLPLRSLRLLHLPQKRLHRKPSTRKAATLSKTSTPRIRLRESRPKVLSLQKIRKTLAETASLYLRTPPQV